jgi:hypothetical protein
VRATVGYERHGIHAEARVCVRARAGRADCRFLRQRSQLNGSELALAAIYSGSAATEPHVQAELTERLAQREQWVRHVAEQLQPHLEPEVTVEEAAAVLSALAMPEIYRELVVTRGWTPDAFEQWLGKTLTRLVLAR